MKFSIAGYRLAFIKCIFFGVILHYTFATNLDEYIKNFKTFTVASNETDGFRQYLRSVKVYKIPHEVLGMGKSWQGGDMRSTGGAYKINLLKEALEEYKNDANRIVMFTDSYDVLHLASVSKIIEKFLSFDARILFAAELWIWPDTSLRVHYPEINNGYRFLNSGGFIGFADSLYELLATHDVGNEEDDQLFFTKVFLNEDMRRKFNIKLDHKAEIFQNLFGATSDILVMPSGNKFELYNVRFNTKPCILHGNGQSKTDFRTLSNYLAERWSPHDGCKDCDENNIQLENLSINDYPKIVMAVFVSKPTPFLREFFTHLFEQYYPKTKLYFFVYNAVPYHEQEVTDILNEFQPEYKHRFKILPSSANTDTITAKHLAIDYCLKKSCDAYLNIDSEARLDNMNTLSLLIRLNRSIVAPMLTRPNKAWSNFWGALDKEGYYRRSFDYMDIINNKQQGLWNEPYVTSCYLINATVLKHPELRPSYAGWNDDYDMAFCASMREKGIYMFVDNRYTYGHLVDLEGFNTTRTNPNMYELFANKLDWERAYLHSDYYNNFEENRTPLQPCPDVYWFPIVSPRFCKELIEIMETFGRWSDGSNQDSRLQGGYEAVPTRDIHMNQVDLEAHWLEFLRLYVTPLQELVFIGYSHNPPRSLMNFMVRYKPDEQPSLRPHHDASTYTVNIALNRPEIDYKGGGCRFIRYNCQVTYLKMGWMLLHPGRLTHYHEGLTTTNGTRYIMVSFVDP